jgi:MYXO-CTERM domain-containing protein
MTDRHPEDEPHDILAAEEFVIGTRDQRLPPDPTGIHEAHDVLAAEEFAMPSPEDHARATSCGPGPRAWLPAAALLVVLFVLVRRRRS